MFLGRSGRDRAIRAGDGGISRGAAGSRKNGQNVTGFDFERKNAVGSETTISQEMVNGFAEDLAAKGQPATFRAVRKEMKEKGISGTNETVRALVANWKEKQRRGGIDSLADLPEEIAQLGLGFMGRVWEIAVRDASIGHEALRKEMVAARNASDERQDLLLQHIATLEAELEAKAHRVVVAEDTSEKARSEMQLFMARAIDAERELARMTERSKGLEEKVLLLERSLGEEEDSLKKRQSELVRAERATVELRELVTLRDGEKEAMKASVARERELSREANERVLRAEKRQEQAEKRADLAYADLQMSKIALAEKERDYLDTKQSLDDALSMMARTMDDDMQGMRKNSSVVAKTMHKS